MTASDIVRATYDATVAMARLRAKHGLIADENAQAIEALVDQTRQLMTEIEKAVSVSDIDHLQDTLRALKPDIDAVNLAGSWRGDLCAPEAGSGYRQAGSLYADTLGSHQKVWEFLRSWWRRSDNDVTKTTMMPATSIMRSWFRPPHM
jgi:hypothetical protein